MKTWPSLAIATALVTACGGGDGPPAAPAPPPPSNVAGTDVPLSATQSAEGAFTFVSSVAAGSSDSAEPLVVGDATLGTSETEEPSPL